MELLLIIPGLILIMFLIVFLKSPRFRGDLGENKVSLIIGGTVEGEQYVINNIIVGSNGKTSQIDHVVINPRGVYVIETKNYSGEIYGTDIQREWTQVLAGGRVKNKIYNPLKQNATHVYKIKKIVGDIPVYSLVVFVQNNTYNIQANNVIGLSQLKSVLEQGQNVLGGQQMKWAYESILSKREDISTMEHVMNKREEQRNLANGICPRCGGKLVLRKGKYGDFVGCSNYPKCRFIMKD